MSDDVVSTSGILPAGEQPPLVTTDTNLLARIDANDGVDAYVPLYSGFAGGEPVKYWDFGEAPAFVIPIYVLVRPDPQGAMHRCVYHGRQYYNIELGQSVEFDELPAPVKKKVANIEARGFTEMQQSA